MSKINFNDKVENGGANAVGKAFNINFSEDIYLRKISFFL